MAFVLGDILSILWDKRIGMAARMMGDASLLGCGAPKGGCKECGGVGRRLAGGDGRRCTGFVAVCALVTARAIREAKEMFQDLKQPSPSGVA